MPILQNTGSTIKCSECAWSQEIIGDAISIPAFCPKCQSSHLTIIKTDRTSIFHFLKKLF